MSDHFKGEFRRTFLREMWLPIASTVVGTAASVWDGLNGGNLAVNLGFMFAVSLLFWGVHWVATVRDVLRVKYYATAAKLDEVLGNQDGRWERCEESSDGYAVHFGDDPHGAEESDDAGTDTDADELGDTEK